MLLTLAAHQNHRGTPLTPPQRPRGDSDEQTGLSHSQARGLQAGIGAFGQAGRGANGWEGQGRRDPEPRPLATQSPCTLQPGGSLAPSSVASREPWVVATPDARLGSTEEQEPVGPQRYISLESS